MLRRVRWAIVAALVAAAAGGTVAVGVLTASASSPTRLSSSQVFAIAQRFAAANGDASPSSMQMVHTTRGEANDVIEPGAGMGFDRDHDVYAIAATGYFTAYQAAVPPGRPLPTGTVLTLVIDVFSGQVLDWGVQDASPSLKAAGAVINAR